MNETIELKTLGVFKSIENDIQEYHEIRQDTTLDDVDTSFSSKQSAKTPSEYDFFTKHDINTKSAKFTKKKKIKKKHESYNIMDIISSEIAAIPVPIEKNVITYITNLKEQQDSYLQTAFRSKRCKSRPVFDAENGWGHNTQAVHINPIFPRVLENAINEDCGIPVEYVYPCSFDEIAAKNSSIDENLYTKFLDVSIQNLIFKHHHNFSLEKLLCLKIIDKYKQYEHVQKSLRDTLRELKIIRETKNNLKKDLAKVSPNKKESIRFDETIRKYTEKIIKLKEKQKEFSNNKKELIHKIVSLWSDIEMVREKAGCVETPFQLEISKSDLDKNKFENDWKEIFDTEFTDKLDIIEYQYINEYLQYKKAKHEQKGNTVKITKPQLQIDEEAIKVEAEELTNSILSKDQIEIELKRDDSIVNGSSRFIKYSYNLEIYVDDVFVCESEHYSSNYTFNVEFTESFSIQILPNNIFIKIVLLENAVMVSHLKIDLAGVKKTSSIAEYKVENFIYENDIAPNANYVESGHCIKDIAVANKVRLRSSRFFKENLFTNCEINVKVGWNDKTEQNQYETIKSSMETGRQLKRLLSGIDKPTLTILMDVISKIYEKDVDDENMIETLKKLSRLEVTDDDSIPIDVNNPDIIRLKLLHLRNNGGFSNITNKLVPIHVSQISTEQLNCLQKTNEKEFDMDYLNSREMEMDPIELQRFIGVKYVQKINNNMLRNLNDYLMQKTHKDVILDYDFSLRSFFSKQSNIGSLATLSTSNKKRILSESLCKEQEINVRILRAFNLLDRSSTVLDDGEDDDDKIAGFKIRPLRPFVRINYKGITAQTVTAIGSHPTWNHTLKIKSKLEPLSPLQINVFDEYKVQIVDGFSEDNQSNSTIVHYRYYNKWLGTIQIPMYTVISLGSIRGTFKIASPPLLFGYETLQNKDSTSLIPEVTQLMKKDASFLTLEVTTSLSHLGGLQAYNQPLPSSPEDDYLINHLNNFITEYTNQFPTRNISLTFIDSAGRNKCVTQFLQPIPLPEKDFFSKTLRCESAISKSSAFSKSSSSSERRRDLDVERVSQEDRESLYSGTIHDGDNLIKMINACLRYVSLIPCYDVTETHVVTLLGVELLKILHGSQLDHTILLASYFIGLGIKCWVAIGLGLPRGLSSFVLIKYDLTTRRVVLEHEQPFQSKSFLNKNDGGYAWYTCDAISGQQYELRDAGCPLKTVDYVFDNENIWVNMQISQDCDNMSFDFTRSSEWQTVFNKTVFVMKQPIVPDHTLYSPPPDVEGLRAALETKIKAKIQKWRSHVKTIWNRYCSTSLREMLPQWEYWAFNTTGVKPMFTQKLKQLMITYKLFGFPLNMPYVNTKSVISTVKSTGFHMTDDPTVEFALAVEVYAYPNNVLSIWVFLATITRI